MRIRVFFQHGSAALDVSRVKCCIYLSKFSPSPDRGEQNNIPNGGIIPIGWVRPVFAG